MVVTTVCYFYYNLCKLCFLILVNIILNRGLETFSKKITRIITQDKMVNGHALYIVYMELLSHVK